MEGAPLMFFCLQTGTSILEEIPLTPQYKKWVDEASTMFGGLGNNMKERSSHHPPVSSSLLFFSFPLSSYSLCSLSLISLPLFFCSALQTSVQLMPFIPPVARSTY